VHSEDDNGKVEGGSDEVERKLDRAKMATPDGAKFSEVRTGHHLEDLSTLRF